METSYLRVQQTGSSSALDAWAKVAWRFRPLRAVLDAIGHVRVDVEKPDVAPPFEEENRANAYARRRILVKLSLNLQTHAPAKLEELKALLEGDLETGHIALRLDVARVRKAILEDVASEEATLALANILSLRPVGSTERDEAARIADLICRL